MCGKKAESCLFGRQMMGFQTRLWSVENFLKVYLKSKNCILLSLFSIDHVIIVII